MTRTLPSILLFISLVLTGKAIIADEPQKDAVVATSAPAFTDADLQHLFNLGTGISTASNQSAQSEVDRIAVAFAQDKPDVRICQYACLAVEKLARFLTPEQAAALAPSVIPCMTNPDNDTREYAMRAARQRVPMLPENSVAHVLEISLKFLSSKEPDDNRRGALLVGVLAPKLQAKDLETSIKAIVVALNANPTANAADTDQPRQIAHDIEIRALAASAASVRDPKLAATIADNLLPHAAVPQEWLAGTHPLIALAQLYTLVDDKTQTKILAVTLEHLDDVTLLYSRTSGIRSPQQHTAAEALLIIIPHLHAADRAKVRPRITEVRANLEKKGLQQMDLDHIFPPLLRALDIPPATQPQ